MEEGGDGKGRKGRETPRQLPQFFLPKLKLPNTIIRDSSKPDVYNPVIFDMSPK